MIRLLALDIDGTLLDSRGRLPDAHREAVAEAVAEGVEVVLATGRGYHFTRHIVDALGVPLMLIVNNGAVVKDATGTTVLRRLLPRDTARRLLAETRAYEESVAVVFDWPGEGQVIFERMDWNHPNRRGYYERNKAFIAAAGGRLADVLTEDPIQVMFNGEVEPMRALHRTLRTMSFADAFTVSMTEYEHRDFTLLDVNRAGCSKGSTLARWTRQRGLDATQVMAVGDNLNDVEMLTFAGTPILMGNASPALRSHGWPVTGTNDEHGLAHAIRRHALRHD